MKKMTKWLAVCAVCVMGSVPAMAAEVPDVTVTPIPIETPAPDVTPIETPAPTPIPEVKNGWYEYGTKNKKYFKEITRFKFKSFMTFNTLVGRINHSREIKIYRDRAYYLWKEFF